MMAITKSGRIATFALSCGLLSVPGVALAAPKPPASVYRPTDSSGDVRGVGTESQDIIAMADQMVRDLLTVPALLNAKTPPRVLVDPSSFKNQSSEIIDKALITDRILVGLNRAAQGRVMFISREDLEDIQAERDMKRKGLVDKGTTGQTAAVAGVDYALTGRISTRDAVNTANGQRSRYTQIMFRMVDMEYSNIIWSNIFEFKKEAGDGGVVYR
ncbi:penicillin-binding protein activator LpoB [Novosphingobium sediminicola]|uniref:Penicillin-binding protein activator LpoB n=1 Tax=Novosphingobium sediminicola TaxID=563162 RepID=A0A7W6CGF2_9SPHN|nr:penicillin-binding protein activator LpoB [Novosphingobium sediminicola]MBB3956054.1 hypothetical protein [Novosphingobium sediminicola]